MEDAATRGREFAEQLLADPQTARGLTLVGCTYTLPDSDYTGLQRRWKTVTADMEAGYRAAFNAVVERHYEQHPELNEGAPDAT